MQKENRLIKITCILLCSVLSALLVYFAVKYLSAAFLPFIFAWGFALSLKKPTDFLIKKAGIPAKWASAFCVIFISFAVIYISVLFFTMLFREARELYGFILENGTQIESTVRSMSEMLERSIQKIPYIGKTGLFSDASASFEEKLASRLSGFFPQFAVWLGTLFGKVARAVPYIALFALVTLIATFYFCMDLEKINRVLASFFPEKPRKTLFIIKEELFSVVFGYIRAYSLIIALTFTELFIGLSIIGTKYTFLISFLIALVDILPVLGAGTVLVPWGILNIVFGNTRNGICLLVLYLIITIIRQMAEPKIVGTFLGLHPLCTLLAMYVGVQLCGIWGVFLFPIGLIAGRNVLRRIGAESPADTERKRG